MLKINRRKRMITYSIDNKIVACYDLKFGILIVDKPYRRMGIGSKLIQARLSLEPGYKAQCVTQEGVNIFSKFNAIDMENSQFLVPIEQIDATAQQLYKSK